MIYVELNELHLSIMLQSHACLNKPVFVGMVGSVDPASSRSVQ